MVCEKCGNKLSDTAAFCPKCGTPCSVKTVNTEKTVHQAGRKQHKKKPFVVAGIIAVLVIIALITVPPFIDSLTGDKEAAENTDSENIQAAAEAVDYDGLLDNLKKADAAIEDLMTKEKNKDSDDSQVRLEQSIANCSELKQTLDGLKEEAALLNVEDDKLRAAVNAYYNAALSFAGTYYDAIGFLYRYIYEESFLETRPEMFNTSNDYKENYAAMSAWLENAREVYNNFEYPSYMEEYWKEYEKILELNQTVMDKYVYAYEHNDMLRLQSCIELYSRVDTVEEKWFQDILNACKTMEKEYGSRNYRLANGLYDEICSYEQMTEQQREKYTFENDLTGKVYYNVECIDTIYPSLYNTYDSFAIVKLAAYGGQRKIIMEVEIPGFTQQYRQSYTITSTPRQIFVKPPLLAGDIDLSAAKSAQININFYEQDGTPLITNSYPVIIKSKNDVEWGSDDFGIFTRDNILCFLTPEANGVSLLKRSAIDEMSRITNKKVESLPGYQELAYNRYAMTYLQAASLMRAMYNEGVRYSMDVFSVSGSQQHILLPDQVIEGKQGLCIETSLTIASALQSAGMHAFLIFPPGHAQVAVEVWKSCEGSGEYFLIETTALSDSINGSAFVNYGQELIEGNLKADNNSCITYYDASEWLEYLKGVEYVIDCNDSRILGMTPFSN